MHRAFMVEAALFFALTCDAANDDPPPPPRVPAQRPSTPALARSASCARASGPGAVRVANSNPAEPMCACVGISKAG